MRSILQITLISGLSLLSSPLQAGILAPNAQVAGRSVGDWGAEWWKWGFSYPAANSPLLVNTREAWEQGDVGGPVFFLMASGGGAVDLALNVPGGQYILFPMLTYLNFVPAAEFDEPLFRAELSGLIDGISGLYAIIDGVAVTNPGFYRSDSAAFNMTIPPDGVDAEGTYRALQGGFWLILEPLQPGIHTIKFGGAVPGDDFFADTTVRITVTPEPGTAGVLALAGVVLIVRRRRS